MKHGLGQEIYLRKGEWVEPLLKESCILPPKEMLLYVYTDMRTTIYSNSPKTYTTPHHTYLIGKNTKV